MSIAPAWLNDTIAAFGRQMGLQHLALNDSGAAAVRFENDLRLAFEYVQGTLMLSIQLPMQPTRRNLQLLLAQSHPQTCAGVHIRSFFLEHTGRAACTVAIPEQQITVNVIEALFHTLWEKGEYLRRNI